MALDLDALQALDADPDLERLAAHISGFNLFEAVGMVSQEIKHSNFLAFLMDPAQNHGLKDEFLKEFLTLALASDSEGKLPISVDDLQKCRLTEAEVMREQDKIDISVRIRSYPMVVIIENKVYSGEREGQTLGYLEATRRRYPLWAILPIYLTLSGAEATEKQYLSVTYDAVANLIQALASKHERSIFPDVVIALHHYVKLLRRHFLSNSELDELCAAIYQRHKRALDVIIERRPDRQAEISRILRQLVGETMVGNRNAVWLAEKHKSYFVFMPDEWPTFDSMISRGPWTESDEGMIFRFDTESNRVRLRLQILPIYDDAIRQRLWSLASNSGTPFKCGRRGPSAEK
jgi:hypothetical protein